MQNTLNFTLDKKKYVSKPFDFESMCLINDMINSKGEHGVLRVCRGALDYLFEGTEATQDIIENMDYAERSQMCLTLFDFYLDALKSKNE